MTAPSLNAGDARERAISAALDAAGFRPFLTMLAPPRSEHASAVVWLAPNGKTVVVTRCGDGVEVFAPIVESSRIDETIAAAIAYGTAPSAYANENGRPADALFRSSVPFTVTAYEFSRAISSSSVAKVRELAERDAREVSKANPRRLVVLSRGAEVRTYYVNGRRV